MDDFSLKAQQIKVEIDKASRILLHLHPSPDTDSVGSALAMKSYLEGIHKEVKVFLFEDEIPIKYNFLKGFSDIQRIKATECDFTQFDLFIALDSGSLSAITKVEWYKIPLPTIVIDHHASNNSYGDINLIGDNYSSTAEILFWLFKQWHLPVSKEIAECLYVGMWGDTGGFKFVSTKPSTLKAFAELVEIGIDFASITNQLTKLTNLQLKALGTCLAGIRFYANGKVLIAFYEKSMAPDLNNGDYLSVREQVRFILSSSSEALIIALVYELKEGIYTTSFRSNNPSEMIDTSVIARYMGGDGHPRASASKSYPAKNIMEAEQITLNAIRQVYPDIEL